MLPFNAIVARQLDRLVGAPLRQVCFDVVSNVQPIEAVTGVHTHLVIVGTYLDPIR